MMNFKLLMQKKEFLKKMNKKFQYLELFDGEKQVK